MEFTIKGVTCWIDEDEDGDLLLDKTWYIHSAGYIVHSYWYGNGKTRILYLHRLILARMLGRELVKGEQCDHINMVRTDNRRENLRLATNGQNNANKGAYKTNKLGVKGVVAMGKRFQAHIGVGNKDHHLGTFDTIEEAHAAYLEAARRMHGEFARGE